MPLYGWKCNKCEEEVEVLRSFSEYEESPKDDEYINRECEHDWEKQIGKVGVKYGAIWQLTAGGKGRP